MPAGSEPATSSGRGADKDVRSQIVEAAFSVLQESYTDELRTQVTSIRDEGWLPGDIDIEAFLMVMMALPFGQVFSDLDESFEVDVLSALALLVPRAPADG